MCQALPSLAAIRYSPRQATGCCASPSYRERHVVLRIEGLAKTYPGGRQALQGVSFELAPGSVVALIGPSGAGKSTLIRCVNRLVEPTAGSITLGATPLSRLAGGRLRAARRRIGMIFQEFGLVERLTAIENVLAGRLGHLPTWRVLLRRFDPVTVQQGFAWLDHVGLLEVARSRADKLSGGQRQRVGIARALLQAEDLLLVDEPTANLDPTTARSIMSLLVGLARQRGLTVLVNLHDLPLARQFAERIVGLRDGRVVFDGPPAELDDEAVARIYGPTSPPDDA